MKIYCAWIVVLTPKVQDSIVAALVNAKIAVQALGRSGTMIHDESSENLFAYTLALKLLAEDEKTVELRDRVVDIFKNKAIKYLSMILIEGEGYKSGWSGSTYNYEKPEPFVVNAGPYRSITN